MVFEQELVPGKLIKRHKRFLADVQLENGEIVTAHCTNSGSMKTCIEESAPVYLSPAKDPKRKTKFTWEMIYINNGWIGINTMVPNILVYDAVKDGKVPGLPAYNHIKREARFDDSRFDVYAENETERCFIEVKNVTMKVGDFARFPDAVTTRGRKHLETLIKAKKKGYRAVMIYVIQRMDVEFFGPAMDIDPEYAETLKKAYQQGVEIIPLLASVSPKEIKMKHTIPINL